MRELTQEDLDLGVLLDVDEFVGRCIEGDIDDSDGYGLCVYEGEVDEKKEVCPSEFHFIDDEVTDILWFNC